MNKNNSFAMLVILWPACTTHHLQNICDNIINISFCFPIIVFSTLQKNGVSAQINVVKDEENVKHHVTLIMTR
jgi:hypothetical protein